MRQAIGIKRDPHRISAVERTALRKRHKTLYDQVDRYVHINETSGAELHCGILDEHDPHDGGTMLALCMDPEIAERVNQQFRDLYFEAGDQVTGRARMACHRVLDNILSQMRSEESNIGTCRFVTKPEGLEFQVVVTSGDPYTDSLEDYVQRLIFIENNAEQMLPHRQLRNFPKPLEN